MLEPEKCKLHLAIRAQAMDRMADFARQALGLEPRGAGKGVTRFGLGDLTVEVFAGAELRDDWGRNPLLPGFEVPNLFAAMTRLEALGVPLQTGILRRHWGMFIFFQDPDGNTWQMFQPQAFRRRTLDGVDYWLIDDPTVRSRHIRDLLEAEWPRHPTLAMARPNDMSPDLEWALAEVKLTDIRSIARQIQPGDPGSPRDAVARILEYLQKGEAIEPLIVRKDDSVLVDGIARLTALGTLGKARALVYLG